MEECKYKKPDDSDSGSGCLIIILLVFVLSTCDHADQTKKQYNAIEKNTITISKQLERTNYKLDSLLNLKHGN